MATPIAQYLKQKRAIIEDDEILTLDEAAAYLKVTKRMLYLRVEKGTIPHLKLGKLIRFQKQALLDWMTKEAGR